MSARMRIVWGIVGLSTVVGSEAEAGVMPGEMSAVNLTTGLPSWKTAIQSSAATSTIPPPAPTPARVVSSLPAVSPAAAPVILPAPDAVSNLPIPAPAPAPVAPAVVPSPLFAAYTPAAPTYTFVAPLSTLVANVSTQAAPVVTQAAPVATPAVNAFVNLGSGPYPEANYITSGNAQPWNNSAQISGFFGGQPTAQQQADFTSTVMQRVEQTFQNSGVAVALTSDPTVAAAHTLSLVSNTSAQTLPSAIGMTDVGSNGFSFIDREAQSAQSLDQLEWIVAHNISHELMLAFGVGENFDTTGNFIDARNANIAMMTNPAATFSPAAAAALNQALASASAGDPMAAPSAQLLEAQVVPEPSTLAAWALGALAVALRIRARRKGS